MRCAGELLRDARRRHGVSQRQLALRAGTSQDAISRIERGVESPTVSRLERLLTVLGEGLELRPVVAEAALTPTERLREAASWNLVATTLELAGERARREGHPAALWSGE